MNDLLARWGRQVYRLRWWLAALSVLSLAPAAAVLARGAALEAETVLTTTESGRAARLIARELPGQPVSFDLILSSATLSATDPGFRDQVQRALAPLIADARVARVRTAYDVEPPEPAYLSRDGRRTRVVVELKERASGATSLEFSPIPPEVYASLRRLVRSTTLDVVAAGNLALNHDFVEVAKRDLARAELVILPLVAILLLLAFGSVVAALLPLGVGVLAMVGGMAGVELLARRMSVSAYAPNIVTMIGLGVAIDYSLFVVSRFREEIARRPIADALAQTMGTAGRAILYSGLTVAIGLLGMLVLGLGNIRSLGLAGTIVVALAVVYGLTFLPAILAVLGTRVNTLSLPLGRSARTGAGSEFWHRLAEIVMAHPWRVFVPVTAVLLLLGVPFLHLRLGAGDETSLPRWAEARRGQELLRRQFLDGDTSQILIVVSDPDGSPLAPGRAGQAWELGQWLGRQPGVSDVASVVSFPGLSRDGAEQLATLPADRRPPPLAAAFSRTVGEHILLLAASTPFEPGSDEARALVRSIRTSHPPVEGQLLVSGRTAFDLDFMSVMAERTPLAIGLVVAATSVALFLLLRSVLLPLKAIVVNLLSISASYGALVWIFQDGHLSRWLDFTPGPIQTATPIIMFCLVFGLSMDYEVLLLSRIREEYDRSGDSTRAVGLGLERTGRLITWAGAIMAGVFLAFALADSVIIKAVGIGIGIAVILDATVVRTLLVPATMRLMGRWNWWVPAFLARRGPVIYSGRSIPPTHPGG
jgi:putative drug exporter of the RND superfamily